MIDKPKFCTKCGYTLTTSTNFCANCGRKIDEIPEKEKPSISQEELDKKGTELPTNKKKISRALLGDDPSSPLYTKGTSGFYGKRNTGKRKIAIAIIIPIMFILLVGSIMSSDDEEEFVSYVPPTNAGKLGDEHEHASLLVRIFGDKFDFSVPSYQIKSSWIHFEESDGTTIHRHASGVTLGYLFDTLNIGIDIQLAETHDTAQEKLEYTEEVFKNQNKCEMTFNEYGNRSDNCGLLSDAYVRCFMFPDGRQFCDTEDYSLKFYINNEEWIGIYDYVFEDGDRILITYGNETHEQIKEQLRELDLQVIKG